MEHRLAALEAAIPRIEGAQAEIMEGLDSIKVELARINLVIAGDGDTKKGIGGRLSLVEAAISRIDATLKAIGGIALLPVGGILAMAVNKLFGSNPPTGHP